MDVLSGLALSIVFAVTPMVLFARIVTRFDQYEKEPTLLLIAMFLWGFFIAAGAAAVINTLVDQVLYMLTGSMNLSLNITAVVTGPFTEEFLKGSAIVVLFVFFRKYFNTVLDGIIYGGLIGFGFAAAENILYIFGGFSAEGVYGLFSVALARILLIPFLHATLTSFTGLGFALARTRKDSLGYIAPVGGFLLAVSMHSLHNLLAVSSNGILLGASFLLDWMGVVALLLLVYRLMAEENGIMKKYLAKEVQLGTITLGQMDIAVSPYKRNVACWRCLDREKRRSLREFYDRLGELAFLENERDSIGSTSVLENDIIRVRGRIKALNSV